MLCPQSYRVLTVSSTPQFHQSLAKFLNAIDCEVVCTVASISAARRELLSRSFDLVLINAPLPDEYGSRLAMDLSGTPGCIVLMLLPSDACEELTAKLSPMGIFTLPKPVSAQQLDHALSWMITARERLRRLEKKTGTVEEKIEQLRLVNRAKWLLIEQLKMTEQEAHRYIEKQAMDRCTSKSDIALSIIKTYT